MTGSVQIKNNKWYTVIYVNGPNKSPKWEKTGLDEKGNVRKAKQILRERISEYEQRQQEQADILFSDFVKNWLDNVIRTQVKANTFHQYSLIVNNSIIPFFMTNKVSLSKLKSSHIQKYYDKKLSDGVSGSTVKRHHANIHKALKYAVKLDLIPSNPADQVELPKREKFIGKAYTEEQIRLLLDKVRNTTIEVPVYLTLVFGLRRSETMGLRWGSIDLEHKRLIINHTIVGNGANLVISDNVKNNTSRRTLTFGEDTKQYFIRLKKHQENMETLLGDSYEDNDYVCKWDDGRVIKPDYVSNTFRKFLIKNKLPVIRFHDLRHTAASVLLNSGCDLKKISTWLGHCDIGTTANIYAHLQFDSKVEMGNILNDTVFPT